MGGFLKSLFRFIIRLAIGLAILLLIAYLLHPYVVKSYLARNYAIDVEEAGVSWSRAEFKNIKSHDQTIAITSVRLQFEPRALMGGALAEVIIEGLKYQPLADPNQPLEIPILLDALDDLPIKINHLDIKDMAIIIPAPGLLTESIQLSGSLSGALGTEKGHVLTLNGTSQPTSVTKGGTLTAQVKGQELTIDYAINEIRLKDIPSAFTIKGSAKQTKGQPLTFTNEITNENHEIYLHAQGQLDSRNAGKLTFQIPPHIIDQQKLPLRIFGEAALNKLSTYSLNVSGEGSLAWSPAGLHPQGTVRVKDGAFAYETAQVKGINFSFPLEQVWSTLSVTQPVLIASIESPILTLSQLSMTVTVSKGHFAIKKATSKIWSGTVQLSNLILSPLPQEQNITLSMDKINLDPLVKQLAISSLSASGQLSGKIPVRLYNDFSLAVINGNLTTLGQGHISYQWDTALQSDNSNLKLAGEALKDFSYNSANININKERGKEPILLLDIKGKNPKLLEGREFNFKINLTGKILQTLESALQSFNGDIKSLKKQAK
jgi:hypothetical protein